MKHQFVINSQSYFLNGTYEFGSCHSSSLSHVYPDMPMKLGKCGRGGYKLVSYNGSTLGMDGLDAWCYACIVMVMVMHA